MFKIFINIKKYVFNLAFANITQYSFSNCSMPQRDIKKNPKLGFRICLKIVL